MDLGYYVSCSGCQMTKEAFDQTLATMKQQFLEVKAKARSTEEVFAMLAKQRKQYAETEKQLNSCRGVLNDYREQLKECFKERMMHEEQCKTYETTLAELKIARDSSLSEVSKLTQFNAKLDLDLAEAKRKEEEAVAAVQRLEIKLKSKAERVPAAPALKRVTELEDQLAGQRVELSLLQEELELKAAEFNKLKASCKKAEHSSATKALQRVTKLEDQLTARGVELSLLQEELHLKATELNEVKASHKAAASKIVDLKARLLLHDSKLASSRDKGKANKSGRDVFEAIRVIEDLEAKLPMRENMVSALKEEVEMWKGNSLQKNKLAGEVDPLQRISLHDSKVLALRNEVERSNAVNESLSGGRVAAAIATCSANKLGRCTPSESASKESQADIATHDEDPLMQQVKSEELDSPALLDDKLTDRRIEELDHRLSDRDAEVLNLKRNIEPIRNDTVRRETRTDTVMVEDERTIEDQEALLAIRDVECETEKQQSLLLATALDSKTATQAGLREELNEGNLDCKECIERLSKVETLKTELSTGRQRLTTLTGELEEMRKEKQALKCAREADRKKSFEEKWRASESRIFALVTELAQLKAEASAANASRLRCEKLEKEVAQQKAEVEKQKAELEGLLLKQPKPVLAWDADLGSAKTPDSCYSSGFGSCQSIDLEDDLTFPEEDPILSLTTIPEIQDTAIEESSDDEGEDTVILRSFPHGSGKAVPDVSLRRGEVEVAAEKPEGLKRAGSVRGRGNVLADRNSCDGRHKRRNCNEEVFEILLRARVPTVITPLSPIKDDNNPSAWLDGLDGLAGKLCHGCGGEAATAGRMSRIERRHAPYERPGRQRADITSQERDLANLITTAKIAALGYSQFYGLALRNDASSIGGLALFDQRSSGEETVKQKRSDNLISRVCDVDIPTRRVCDVEVGRSVDGCVRPNGENDVQLPVTNRLRKAVETVSRLPLVAGNSKQNISVQPSRVRKSTVFLSELPKLPEVVNATRPTKMSFKDVGKATKIVKESKTNTSLPETANEVACGWTTSPNCRPLFGESAKSVDESQEEVDPSTISATSVVKGADGNDVEVKLSRQRKCVSDSGKDVLCEGSSHRLSASSNSDLQIVQENSVLDVLNKSDSMSKETGIVDLERLDVVTNSDVHFPAVFTNKSSESDCNKESGKSCVVNKGQRRSTRRTVSCETVNQVKSTDTRQLPETERSESPCKSPKRCPTPSLSSPTHLRRSTRNVQQKVVGLALSTAVDKSANSEKKAAEGVKVYLTRQRMPLSTSPSVPSVTDPSVVSTYVARNTRSGGGKCRGGETGANSPKKVELCVAGRVRKSFELMSSQKKQKSTNGTVQAIPHLSSSFVRGETTIASRDSPLDSIDALPMPSVLTSTQSHDKPGKEFIANDAQSTACVPTSELFGAVINSTPVSDTTSATIQPVYSTLLSDLSLSSEGSCVEETSRFEDRKLNEPEPTVLISNLYLSSEESSSGSEFLFAERPASPVSIGGGNACVQNVVTVNTDCTSKVLSSVAILTPAEKISFGAASETAASEGFIIMSETSCIEIETASTESAQSEIKLVTEDASIGTPTGAPVTRSRSINRPTSPLNESSNPGLEPAGYESESRPSVANAEKRSKRKAALNVLFGSSEDETTDASTAGDLAGSDVREREFAFSSPSEDDEPLLPQVCSDRSLSCSSNEEVRHISPQRKRTRMAKDNEISLDALYDIVGVSPPANRRHSSSDVTSTPLSVLPPNTIPAPKEVPRFNLSTSTVNVEQETPDKGVSRSHESPTGPVTNDTVPPSCEVSRKTLPNTRAVRADTLRARPTQTEASSKGVKRPLRSLPQGVDSRQGSTIVSDVTSQFDTDLSLVSSRRIFPASSTLSTIQEPSIGDADAFVVGEKVAARAGASESGQEISSSGEEVPEFSGDVSAAWKLAEQRLRVVREEAERNALEGNEDTDSSEEEDDSSEEPSVDDVPDAVDVGSCVSDCKRLATEGNGCRVDTSGCVSSREGATVKRANFYNVANDSVHSTRVKRKAEEMDGDENIKCDKESTSLRDVAKMALKEDAAIVDEVNAEAGRSTNDAGGSASGAGGATFEAGEWNVKGYLLTKAFESYVSEDPRRVKHLATNAPKTTKVDVGAMNRAAKAAMSRLPQMDNAESDEPPGGQVFDSLLKQLASVNIAILLKYLLLAISDDEGEVDTPPAPPLTPTQRQVVTLAIKLDASSLPGLLDELLKVIEQRVCHLGRFSMEESVMERLTRVYTAVCIVRNHMARLRCFLYDALYCVNRSFKVAQTLLEMVPFVLPHAFQAKDDLLTHTVVCSLLNKKDNEPVLYSPLTNLLKHSYKYSAANHMSALQIVALAVDRLKRGEDLHNVEMSLVLLAKRAGWQWAERHVAPPLRSLVDQWRKGGGAGAGVLDQSAAIALSVCSHIARTYPKERVELVVAAMWRLQEIMLTGKAFALHETALLCLLGLCSFHKNHRTEVAKVLLHWTPTLPASKRLIERVVAFMANEPPTYWRHFFKRYSRAAHLGVVYRAFGRDDQTSKL